jgi:hypothetical protein
MVNESGILETENWLYFKLYRKSMDGDSWKTPLDWYHNVLRDVVKPWVNSNVEVKLVFFGIYGPEDYGVEPVEYQRRISSHSDERFYYVRLRANVTENMGRVKNSLAAMIQANTALIFDYEILEYRVRDDLGNRYGRLNDGTIDDQRTVMFIRYWDAACRYIMEVLTSPGNWDNNVDVWGVPHLVNNSLGAWLRISDANCPRCSISMYLATWREMPHQLRPQLAAIPNAPICLLVCPQCSFAIMAPMNI